MKGTAMDYLKWSNEYKQTASELEAVLARLKRQRARASDSVKKELSDKITLYKGWYKECIEIAHHLMERHRGVA